MDTADSVSDVLVWRLRRTAYPSADDAWRPAAQLPRRPGQARAATAPHLRAGLAVAPQGVNLRR